MISKHIFRVILVCAVVMLFGCGTPPGKITYDPDLPKEKTTRVEFYASIMIKQYNGIDIMDAWYPNGKYRQNTVTLPGGPTAILFDVWHTVNYGNSAVTFRIKDIELRFDFEAGKEYTFGSYAEKTGFLGLGKTKMGVAVWEGISTAGRSKDKALKFWELGEYDPL